MRVNDCITTGIHKCISCCCCKILRKLRHSERRRFRYRVFTVFPRRYGNGDVANFWSGKLKKKTFVGCLASCHIQDSVALCKHLIKYKNAPSPPNIWSLMFSIMLFCLMSDRLKETLNNKKLWDITLSILNLPLSSLSTTSRELLPQFSTVHLWIKMTFSGWQIK